jgi:ABC-2 type transport system permease protein
MITLIKLEVLRVLRNRRYLFFTLILPAVLYLMMVGAYGKTDGLDGVSVKEYFMVAMATLGTVSASMTSNANRIALERKSGWARQLRLTALPGYGYVVAKIASTAASTLPAILIVFALAYGQGVRLSGSEWLLVGLTLWVGGFVFAALGVALGYSASPDSIQPIIMIVYTVMLIVGGTYGQIGGSFGTFAKWTPIALYNQLGRVAQTGASVSGGTMLAVAAYALAFGGLAAFLYQRDRRES